MKTIITITLLLAVATALHGTHKGSHELTGECTDPDGYSGTMKLTYDAAVPIPFVDTVVNLSFGGNAFDGMSFLTFPFTPKHWRAIGNPINGYEFSHRYPRRSQHWADGLKGFRVKILLTDPQTAEVKVLKGLKTVRCSLVEEQEDSRRIGSVTGTMAANAGYLQYVSGDGKRLELIKIPEVGGRTYNDVELGLVHFGLSLSISYNKTPPDRAYYPGQPLNDWRAHVNAHLIDLFASVLGDDAEVWRQSMFSLDLTRIHPHEIYDSLSITYGGITPDILPDYPYQEAMTLLIDTIKLFRDHNSQSSLDNLYIDYDIKIEAGIEDVALDPIELSVLSGIWTEGGDIVDLAGYTDNASFTTAPFELDLDNNFAGGFFFPPWLDEIGITDIEQLLNYRHIEEFTFGGETLQTITTTDPFEQLNLPFLEVIRRTNGEKFISLDLGYDIGATGGSIGRNEVTGKELTIMGKIFSIYHIQATGFHGIDGGGSCEAGLSINYDLKGVFFRVECKVRGLVGKARLLGYGGGISGDYRFQVATWDNPEGRLVTILDLLWRELFPDGSHDGPVNEGDQESPNPPVDQNPLEDAMANQ